MHFQKKNRNKKYIFIVILEIKGFGIFLTGFFRIKINLLPPLKFFFVFDYKVNRNK